MHGAVNSNRLAISHSYTDQTWNGHTSHTERTNLMDSPAGKQPNLNVPAWFILGLLAVGRRQLCLASRRNNLQQISAIRFHLHIKREPTTRKYSQENDCSKL